MEPLIPMDDQEIISPYSINTIYSKVYMRSSFFLFFSNRHTDYDRYTEVCYGDKIENNEKKNNNYDVSALHLTPRVLRLIFSSTGITDLANYSLRKYPLYDLMRRSIRNFPGSLQCILEDHFIHRDHICISCSDVYFSPFV